MTRPNRCHLGSVLFRRRISAGRLVSAGCLVFFSLDGGRLALASSLEAPPPIWAEEEWGYSVSSSYFNTRANYDDSGGSYTRLPGDNEFSILETQVRARYGLTSRLSLSGGAGFSYADVLDPNSQKTRTGVSDVWLGAGYLLWRKGLRLMPDLQIGAPVEATESGQSEPLLSNGVPFARLSVFAFKTLGRFKLRAHAGAYLPSDGLASLVEYSADISIPFSRRFAIGGGVNGYDTLVSDTESPSAREITTTAANAGSRYFYAYDPSLIEGRFWISFLPDPALNLKVGYGKTIDGVRAAEGQAVLFSAQFNPPVAQRSRRGAADVRVLRKKQNRANKIFAVDPEKIDQNLFLDEAGAESRESDEDPLDATEHQLENKRNR